MSVICGDSLEVMQGLDPNSADTIITDPPYGLKFMGKEWDHGVPGVPYWTEALRVAKPGAMLMAFGGTRTHHRLMCAIEDAGWELRDTIMWVYGSGFPKSLAIDKAIDRKRADNLYPVTKFIATARDAAGMTNADIDAAFGTHGMAGHWTSQKSQPAVATWEQWEQLRTLLGFGNEMDAEVWRLNGRKGKPGDSWNSREFLCKHAAPAKSIYSQAEKEMGRDVDITAPATEAAKLWNGWGTALKPAYEPIILAMKPLDGTFAHNAQKWGVAGLWIDGGRVGTDDGTRQRPPSKPSDKTFAQDAWTQDPANRKPFDPQGQGRWPANLILDGSEEVLGLFPQTNAATGRTNTVSKGMFHGGNAGAVFPDAGSAARFFYCAKASRSERTCNGQVENKHPTVKPLALMEYLCKLTRTPTGGIVLDPFCGSGSTLMAAKKLGRGYIGIDNDETSCATARARLATIEPPLCAEMA